VREATLAQALECLLEGYRVCADAMVDHKYWSELERMRSDVVILV
jgi:hypothetical protein